MNRLETRSARTAPWTAALLLIACGSNEAPVPSPALAEPSGQFLPTDDVECITNWIANLE